MAAIDYKQMETKVDALALKYKVLAQKDNLTHNEQKEREDCIRDLCKLLMKYASEQNRKKQIYKENPDDIDNFHLWDVIRRTLEFFSKNDNDKYFILFSTYYGKRMPTIVSDYLDTNRQGNNKFDVQEISIDDDNNNVAIPTMDKGIESLDTFDGLDRLLDFTYEAASKQGKTWPRNMRGYWSIRFIELDRPEKWAREKEKHIMLLFFLQNRHFYDEYEERIFEEYGDDYENLTETQSKKLNKKLHKKVISELHKELMSKMSIELKLQPSRWYDCYLDVFNFIVRARHQLHL